MVWLFEAWLWTADTLIWNWWSLGLFFLFAIWTEHSGSHGWTTFWGILVLVSTQGLFSIDWSLAWRIAAVWTVVGFILSFWWWKKYCDSVIKQVDGKEGYHDVGWARREMDLNRNKSKIAWWIVIWPILLLDNVVGDGIYFLGVSITTIGKHTYERITERSLNKLPPELRKEKAD